MRTYTENGNTTPLTDKDNVQSFLIGLYWQERVLIKWAEQLGARTAYPLIFHFFVVSSCILNWLSFNSMAWSIMREVEIYHGD